MTSLPRSPMASTVGFPPGRHLVGNRKEMTCKSIEVNLLPWAVPGQSNDEIMKPSAPSFSWSLAGPSALQRRTRVVSAGRAR